MPSYKVVPGPTELTGDQCCGALSGGSSKQLRQAATTMAAIIEREAQNGWLFHGIDGVTVHNACCLCFAQPPCELKLLVFVHE